jgi:hypothetical protein
VLLKAPFRGQDEQNISKSGFQLIRLDGSIACKCPAILLDTPDACGWIHLT